MKIPDNFILLVFALAIAVVTVFIPETSTAMKIINQLWTVLLVLITPGANLLPRGAQPKPESGVVNEAKE